MIEKIKKKLIDNLRIVYALYAFGIFLILIILAGDIVINIGNRGFTGEEYKVLLGLIGIAISISGLSFRASSSSIDINDKWIFYIQGKRLFFASMLFIIVLSSKYITSEYHSLQSIPIPIIGKYIYFCVFWIYLPAMMGGLFWTMTSFIALYKIVTKGIAPFEKGTP